MNIQTPVSELFTDTPVHDATQMTNQNGLARIVLRDQVYTLRITRAGKLILTK
ncbi:hemin uptake protein HemP [Cognatishimia sp. SS12]|uniref:hemin uptake protein HemP n=1 Tax=Cognatishimia sp. SS12 TaxID=2979465 RepID=UPI00232B8604|nr:hemin uptake protein HemP [Cognatishimia sp. SS12]MDC0738459.1 hemin uptake protein HemP [Cognatishimia sp. SS12]